MRDYDSTVKNLREAAKGLLFDAMPYRASVMRDAADAIEELLDELTTIRKQLPHWISVEERMPEKDETVIVYYSWTGQSGTEYRETSLATLDEMRYCGNKLLGWMPLPAPPKGVE